MKDKKLSLFHAFGIEAEYMIVDRDSLNVVASASYLLTDDKSTIQNELTFEKTAWSNELASHLIEIKTNGPVPELDSVEKIFHSDILKINSILQKKNLMLMPTAMHPWMNPDKEFVIWPHENQEIYNAYDDIFNCKGHGWSNLQSVHINLGYASEEEFRSLHAAIRILLPLIPALAASSPILEARGSKYLDTRLHFYSNNQKIIPEIAGNVIPEVIQSEEEYRKIILEPMYEAIAKYDTNQILQDEWLNSRGAIARFDRSAIEIRLMDIQECPKADLSLVKVFVLFLQHMIEKCSVEDMNAISTPELREILDSTILHGTKTTINNSKLLQLLGFNQSTIPILDIFIRIPSIQSSESQILEILQHHGNLSERILSKLGGNDFNNSNSISNLTQKNRNVNGTKGNVNQTNEINNPEIFNQTNIINNPESFKLLQFTYRTICECLQKNEFYIPK